MGFTTSLFGGERSLLIAHIKEAMAGEVCPVCALAREAERFRDERDAWLRALRLYDRTLPRQSVCQSITTRLSCTQSGQRRLGGTARSRDTLV